MRSSASVTLSVGAIVAMAIGVGASTASAGTVAMPSCQFRTSGSKMYLLDSCVTTQSILIPNGKTLDGQNFTITAQDPIGGSFQGPVVTNAGTKASARRLVIDARNLADSCHTGNLRHAGIQLTNASGAIEDNTILGPNMGLSSSCGEGSAIRLLADPQDGTHPKTRSVTVRGNTVSDFQLYGIVALGDVKATVKNNTVRIGTQYNVYRRGIAVLYGAAGRFDYNTVTYVGGGGCGIVEQTCAAAQQSAAEGPANVDPLDAGSNGLMALDVKHVGFKGNTVTGVNVAAFVTSQCNKGSTTSGVTLESNSLDAWEYGVFLEANISSSTMCSPLNYKTTVKRNTISSALGIGGTGVQIAVGGPSGGFTPVVSYATIYGNTVTGFSTCFVDQGGTKTKQYNNTWSCAPI